jgi:zinc protease
MKIHLGILASASALLLASLGTIGCSGAKPKGATVSAPAPGGIPLVGAFKVHRFSLENGLRLLVVEDHSSPTFAYQTWFRVGSRDEVPGLTGLAHLFEHMMFKGTTTYKEGEFDRILETAGAEGENAFTSRDYTAYVQEMPADKLDLIAKLESDRMVNLVVNEESFKTEREVVQNERRFRNENSPDGLMYQELFGLSFEKHSYRWPVIGYDQDLAAMKGDNALAFYRSHYSPNHATVVITGDVTPDQALAAVKKHYSALKPQEAAPHEIPTEPAQAAVRRKQLKLNIQVEKLMMGYHIPGILHEDMPKLDVLGSILAGGKSSRLHRALVETGIATGIETYDLEDKDPSLFVVEASLQKGKRASQAEAVILREVAKIARQGVRAEEVERAKNRANFAFYESMNTNPERARFLGHYEAVAGDFQSGLEFFQKIQEVTAADVQAVAKAHLDANNRNVITGVSK